MLSDDMSLFSAAEYERRLAGLRELMAANDMDAVLITTDANHRYFTGHATHRWTHKYTAIMALLPREGDSVLLLTAAEACMAAEDSWIEDVRTFSSDHALQGVAAIIDAVRDLGLEQGRIGTELGGMAWMRMPYQDFEHLRPELPRVEFVDASPLFWKLRARKSPAEVALVRQAVAITDAAYQVLFREVKPGMTERDTHSLLAVEHLQRGADMPGSITIAPHVPGDLRPANRTLRRHTDRVLTEGELIAQDAGGSYRGYWSDYTRMFALGRASATHREAYRVVYGSLQAAIGATRPGVPIADLIDASNAAIDAAGYAQETGPISIIGHAIGLDIIEPPFISHENDVSLEEGMILTIEPSLYVDGAFIMLEEDVLVTETGREVLSAPANPELPIL